MKAKDIFKKASRTDREGKPEKARQLYQQLMDKFPDTEEAQHAKEQIDALLIQEESIRQTKDTEEKVQNNNKTEVKEYEFTKTQNDTTRMLSDRMKWVGIFLTVLGAEISLRWLINLQENPGQISDILLGIIIVLIGVWTTGAAKSFSLIVKRKGGDITNLMEALSSLKKIYNSEFWLMIIFLIAIHFLLVLYIMIEQGGGISLHRKCFLKDFYMYFELSITISQPPAEVFTFLRDKEKYPQKEGSPVLLLEGIFIFSDLKFIPQKQ